MNNTPTVKDSGVRESFPTGSVRDTRAGKGRYDLLPTRALRRVARHFEAGATKYGDRNWERGQPISRYLDSALRHTFNHLEGQRDEDHLAAAAWNILAAIETGERVKAGILPESLDDAPRLTTPEKCAQSKERSAPLVGYTPPRTHSIVGTLGAD